MKRTDSPGEAKFLFPPGLALVLDSCYTQEAAAATMPGVLPLLGPRPACRGISSSAQSPDECRSNSSNRAQSYRSQQDKYPCLMRKGEAGGTIDT